jgi:sugar phosphate isomerase/epimerase
LIRAVSSEWIGVLVDTGNNLALLEEPYDVIEALAPWALSVHLKDIALQPCADGFLLSEVPIGTGMLDLPRMVSTLRRANPGIALNLEMATRDPLCIPCLKRGYYATFAPPYREERLATALALTTPHPPSPRVPGIAGKSVAVILAEEDAYNRESLMWMHRHLRT